MKLSPLLMPRAREREPLGGRSLGLRDLCSLFID